MGRDDPLGEGNLLWIFLCLQTINQAAQTRTEPLWLTWGTSSFGPACPSLLKSQTADSEQEDEAKGKQTSRYMNSQKH